MPLPFLSVPAFPNVPQLPGVPPLARDVLAPFLGPRVARLTTDIGIIERLLGLTASPQWGIFDNAVRKPVLIGDAVISIAPQSEAHVPDYPIENGGFRSYNKVKLPNEVLVTIAQGGTLGERESFVSTLKTLEESLTLYAVVAPDSTFTNLNVTGVRWERTAREGSQLIVADIRLREIRLAPAPAFSNTKDVVSAATQNGGPVQAQAPTAAQQAVAGTAN